VAYERAGRACVSTGSTVTAGQAARPGEAFPAPRLQLPEAGRALLAGGEMAGLERAELEMAGLERAGGERAGLEPWLPSSGRAAGMGRPAPGRASGPPDTHGCNRIPSRLVRSATCRRRGEGHIDEK
jgi:hypothetical protein